MKNKKASPDVVLLVFMTIVLMSWTLFTFISNSNNISIQVKDVRFLDNFYINEDLVEFYIEDIMEESIKEININGDIKSQFILIFNNKIQIYKTNKAFLYYNLNNFLANMENVKIINNQIHLKINLNANKQFSEDIKVTYLSKKVFIKDLL